MSNVRIPLPGGSELSLVRKSGEGYSRMNDSGESQKKALTESQPVRKEQKTSRIKSLFHSLPSIPVFGKKKKDEEDKQDNPSFQNRL